MTATSASNRPTLLLLTRPECHLCEEFRAALEQAFPGRFAIQEACVDDDAEWRRRYGYEIPVLLTPAGEPLARVRFDAEAARRVAALVGAA